MMVASAARTWWARRPWRGQAGPSAFGRTTARITTFTLLVLSLAVIACAAAGLTTTLRNDLRQAAERHRMLQATLSELRGTLSADGRFDHAQLGVIERRTGLNDLRFDSDLAADAGREVQSLHDGQGRIVGWFSWMPDRSLITSMNRLWGVVGAVGLLLVVAAVVALQTTQRLSRSVARSADTIRKLTTQDSLTGLPNRRVMLDRLDQVVAGRAGGVVVFALIDIDGFHDVNETLGWAGGNAMLASIADRFKARLPAGAIPASRPRSSRRSARRSRRRFSWTRCGRSASASALRRRRKTASRVMSSAAAPRLLCAQPSAAGAARYAALCRRSRKSTRNAVSFCASLKPRSARKPLTSTISRSSPRRAAAWSALRRCCAGPTRRAARLRRPCLFRSPRRAG